MNPDQRLRGLRGAIIPVLLVVTIGLWLFTPRTRAKPIHGPCLVHSDCHASERCLVVPKGDGFATQGECVDACADDLQCPAQMRCERFSDSGDFMAPAPSGEGASGGCRAGARK